MISLSARATLILITGMFLLFATASNQQQNADAASHASKIAEPELSPALQRGKLAYEKFCASCHGVKTAGTEKGPTFLHRVYHPGHHGDGAFALAARRGARAHHWRFGDMKPVSGVSDQELKEIVGYVRALQKANGIF